MTWRTVTAASESAWPVQRTAYPDRGSKVEPVKPLIEEMLVADLEPPASSGTPRPGSSVGSSTSRLGARAFVEGFLDPPAMA